jgi:hypothetical protein
MASAPFVVAAILARLLLRNAMVIQQALTIYLLVFVELRYAQTLCTTSNNVLLHDDIDGIIVIGKRAVGLWGFLE